MKRTHLLLMLLAFCLVINAQPISQEQAMNRAASYLKSAPVADRAHRAKQQLRMKSVSLDIPNLYAFDIQGGGYVIASGDERALPVLGYSMSTHMDWDSMPDNMRWWLQCYSQEIEALEDAEITEVATPDTRADKVAIAPLMTSKWDQSPLYNMLCPRYNGQVEKYAGNNCVTGCVATAMAQVMNYHQWPKEPTKSIPGYRYTISDLDPENGVVENFDLQELAPVTFDWDNMCDRLTERGGATAAGVTRNNIMAVARLMQYCGQSVRMSYSPGCSASYTQYVAQALRTYFGYDKGVRTVSRMYYSIKAWEDLIYQELANNRPVVYAGISDDGGHEFVCDGYDGNGMFHINWGWGGVCDEYFSLSVLNPYAQNVSGVLFPNIGFCINQGAVIGIQPPTEGTVAASDLPELENLTKYTVTDMGDYFRIDVQMSYVNFIYPQASFFFYLGLRAPDGQIYMNEIMDETLDMTTPSFPNLFFTLPKTDTGLPDGIYRVIPYYKCLSVDNSEIVPLGPSNMYIEWTISKGVATCVSVPAVSKISITRCEITQGTGEPNTPNDITLTIRNRGSEYQGALWLKPYFIGNDDPKDAWQKVTSSDPLPEYYEEMNYLMGGAYIKSGSTVSSQVTFSFTPKKTGRYLLCLSEDYINDDYIPAPFAYASIEISDPTSLNEELRVKGEELVGAVYDLSGRRINSQLKNGLYIVKGKKTVNYKK